MSYNDASDSELSTQFDGMIRSKFTPPYMDEQNRRAIDSIIMEIWGEMQRRKTLVEDSETESAETD
jgi:hypothetical protein